MELAFVALVIVAVVTWNALSGEGSGAKVQRPKVPRAAHEPPIGAKPGAAPGIWSIEVETARENGWGRAFGLVWRFPDATWLVDLREREAANIPTNSLLDEVDADMETAGHPGKLRIWAVTGEQAAAWNADVETIQALLEKLVRLSVQRLGPVQPGEVLVIVGEPVPDPALVYLLKSGGFSVWHIPEGTPIPALIVGTGGQLLSGMHGEAL